MGHPARFARCVLNLIPNASGHIPTIRHPAQCREASEAGLSGRLLIGATVSTAARTRVTLMTAGHKVTRA